jgi:hypothetical protein
MFIVLVPERSRTATRRGAALMRHAADVAQYERRFRGFLVLYRRHYCRNYLGDLIMQDLSRLTYEQANYQLAMGYATMADAIAYCDVWNKVKTATRAEVLTETRKPHWTGGAAISVPFIHIIDL